VTKSIFVEIFESDNMTRITQHRNPIPSTSSAVPACVLITTIEKKTTKARRMNFHPWISVKNELKANMIAKANMTPEKTGCPRVPLTLSSGPLNNI
jgi:hypothetical protein